MPSEPNPNGAPGPYTCHCRPIALLRRKERRPNRSRARAVQSAVADYQGRCGHPGPSELVSHRRGPLLPAHQSGLLNDNAIFRVLPGFVVQWGISGDPQVNKKWNEAIKDDPPKVSNKIGTIVFAKTGQPDSRTTQVFINLGDNSAALDPQGFTPFGEVIQGMDNVAKFYTGYGE